MGSNLGRFCSGGACGLRYGVGLLSFLDLSFVAEVVVVANLRLEK